MFEPKYIYRPVPCPVYRVEAFQTWLEDMAREGLILEKDSFLLGLATFTRQSPKHYRYRLEPTPDIPGIFNDYDTPDTRAVEMNADFGWEYVTRRDQFYIYRCENPHAPELHTDPQIQQLSLQAMKKRSRSALLWSIFNLFFLTWLNLGFMLTIACAFLGTPLIAAGLLILLESFSWRLQEVLHLRKLCARMKQGESPTQKADWQTGRHYYRVRSILSVLFTILWFSAVFTAKSDAEYLLSDYDQPLPFATFTEIFPESEVTLEDSFVDSKVILYSDLLIPETIEYSFHGDIRFDEYETAYGILHVNYHRAASPFLARQLAKDYQRHAGRQNRIFGGDKRIPYDVSSVDADYIICYNEGINVILILCKGNEIIRCTYLVRGHNTDPEIVDFAKIMAASLG